jgi:signal transduction histidine kinase
VPRLRSVVSRILALHVLAVLVTSIVLPLALFILIRNAAEDLYERALRQQGGEILRYLDWPADRAPHLALPPGLADLYSKAYGRYGFAVLDGDGRVLFSSSPGKRALSPLQRGGQAFHYFSERYGNADVKGVTIGTDINGHHLWVQVAQDLAHRDVLIDDIVAEFFTHVAWITAPLLMLLLVADVVIFRRALRPIVAASEMAERIGPERTELRLPEARMPQEVLPLVRAVNLALDRLERGLLMQREFTADAAHELRTPLAILRTQIDMIADRDLAAALRHDVEGMSRLVNQLLDIAELETLAIGADEVADLAAIAAEIAGFVAPLALARGNSLAVSGNTGPVLVRGNGDALARALRNLVENALAHTPAGTAVEIEVTAAGALRVLDNGPGIAPSERAHIFRRFWRRDRRRPGSAGLGLAIVARIAEMHGAAVSVEDRPGGGAAFTIRFPAVLAGDAADPAAAEFAPAL